MKKFLALSTLVFFLGGCNWFGGAEDPSLKQHNYPYYTEVQGYVATENWKPGVLYTHRLNDITGNLLIPMKSTAINLSKYDGSEIVAKGQVSLASDNKTEVLLVESANLVQAENKQKTFSTGSLSFSFQYPDSLSVRKLVSGVKLNDIDDNTVFYFTEEKKASDDLAGMVSKIALAGQKVLEVNIDVDGKPAIRRVEDVGGVRFTTIFMLGREDFYTLKFLNPDSAHEAEWSEVFDEIMDSFNASDLGELVGTGETCGGTMQIACPSGLLCLLSSENAGAEGVCITEETYTKDTQTLREGCNNTEGFIQEHTATCDYTTCKVMPTCTCSGTRLWDQIEGCIDQSSVDLTNTTGEKPTETEVAPPTKNDNVVEPPKTPAETPADSTGTITPSSQISGGMRRMESDPWNFAMDYPKNWYFMSLGGGKYAFAPNVDPELNPAVTVSVVDSCQSVAGVICAEMGAKTFELSYASAYAAEASAMSASITLLSE